MHDTSLSRVLHACISASGVTALIEKPSHPNSDTVCDFLNEVFVKKGLKNIVLFVDGWSANHSGQTVSWAASHGIEVRTLLVKGADVNPIEQLWSILSRRLFPFNCIYDSKEALWNRLLDEWDHISKDKDMLKRLVESVPNRVEKVIELKGKQIV